MTCRHPHSLKQGIFNSRFSFFFSIEKSYNPIITCSESVVVHFFILE
jgi:hypothetical protein